ncbi:MAG: hypothetical protein WC312_05255 [Candidatus Omnitrophota bacterium]|jgi:hypothetical protein
MNKYKVRTGQNLHKQPSSTLIKPHLTPEGEKLAEALAKHNYYHRSEFLLVPVWEKADERMRRRYLTSAGNFLIAHPELYVMDKGTGGTLAHFSPLAEKRK